ncbi:MAG: hypothetical protein GX349_04320 [Firmicutes bacterium]|nr:hypothetical protein [Bacillota bacterium]
MVKKPPCYHLIGVLLAVILTLTACGRGEDTQEPVLDPPRENPKAVSFGGKDLLTGADIEFAPGDTGRPSLIAFFSPG